MRAAAGLILALAVAACGGAPEEPPSLRLRVEAAPPSGAIDAPAPDPVADLSPAAQAKVAEIRAVIARNSLSRFARLADGEPARHTASTGTCCAAPALIR